MIKITLIYGFTFTLIICCSGFQTVTERNRRAGNYDQVVLTLLQPITAFKLIHNVWPQEDDFQLYNISSLSWNALTIPGYWIISSFWPYKADGNHPTYCYEDDTVEVTIGSGLIPILKYEWPDFTSKEHQVELWKEAWRKHGTCMVDLYDIDNENDYFTKASRLLYENNLGVKIKSNDIFTGRKYRLYQLQGAVQRFLEVNGNLECIIDEDGEQYILGGSVCFNRFLEREECLYVAPSPCDENKFIHMPNLR